MKMIGNLRILVLGGMILVGIWTRLIGIDWGSPFHFHPDERNVASAVTRLDWETSMNPEFFAYGSLPIYAIYAGVELILYLGGQGDPFAVAVLVSRAISAILSIVLIPLMYWWVKRYFQESVALLAAGMTTFCVGFIQFAHYGTFEMWLTVETFVLLICTIEMSKRLEWVWVLLAGVLMGMAIGTKVTSLVLLPGVGVGFIAYVLMGKKGERWIRWGESVVKGGVFLLIAGVVFANSNPFAFNRDQVAAFMMGREIVDGSLTAWLNPEFLHSIRVEGQIARGELEVFYTRQFVDTVPAWFQFMKVYPWILSEGVVVLGLLGMALMGWRGLRRGHWVSLMIVVWWLLQMVFLGSLYVKWTRYLVPTLPYLIIAAAWVMMLGMVWIRTRIMIIVIWLVVGTQAGWAVAYSMTYLREDPRLALEKWAVQNLEPQTKILSEVYDLGIIPLNAHFDNIELFNFYELDHPALGESRRIELATEIEEAEVFIILSRRLWRNSLQNSREYPAAAAFYDDLFTGRLGLVKVAEFSNPPGWGDWVINDELGAEETFSVFERPRIQVWSKVH